MPLRHSCPHRQGGDARGRCVREGSHDDSRFSTRRAQARRRPGRQLLVRRCFRRDVRPGGQAPRGHRGRLVSRDRCPRLTVYSGKVDLGTGVATALPQIVADELDVPLNRIKLVQGDTALTPDQGTTWGSLSIQVGGMQLRNAAATARAALLEEAAKRLNAKTED